MQTQSTIVVWNWNRADEGSFNSENNYFRRNTLRLFKESWWLANHKQNLEDRQKQMVATRIDSRSSRKGWGSKVLLQMKITSRRSPHGLELRNWWIRSSLATKESCSLAKQRFQSSSLVFSFEIFQLPIKVGREWSTNKLRGENVKAKFIKTLRALRLPGGLRLSLQRRALDMKAFRAFRLNNP